MLGPVSASVHELSASWQFDWRDVHPAATRVQHAGLRYDVLQEISVQRGIYAQQHVLSHRMWEFHDVRAAIQARIGER